MKLGATFSTLLLAAVLYGCAGDSPPSHLDIYHLKGSVKSIHKRVEREQRASEARAEAEDFYYEFNRQGFLTGYRAYDRTFSHEDADKEAYTYNSKSYVAKRTVYSSRGTTKSEVSRAYTWGEDGKPTEAQLSDGTKLAYSYDASDGSFEQTLCNANGSPIYRNRYNARNQPLELLSYESGELLSKSAFEYNPQGYLARQATYGGNEVLVEAFDYLAFDASGNPTRCERMRMLDSQLVTDTLSYSYDYDAKDNWIRRVATSQGRQVELVTRAFEYY